MLLRGVFVTLNIASHCKGFKLSTNYFRFNSIQPKLKHFKMSNDILSEHIYTNDTPVLQLDAKTAFNGLDTKEKLYSHHLSKSSWYGSLAVLFQVKYHLECCIY